MSEELEDFEQFLKRRGEVARSYVRGDAAPLGEIVARTPPATFFGPQGDYRQGADEVWSTYEHDAGSFGEGGDSQLEILQSAASDSLAYWVGLQRATAFLEGNPKPVPMTLRVTELFRREGGKWKLIHRHADPLKAEGKEKDA